MEALNRLRNGKGVNIRPGNPPQKLDPSSPIIDSAISRWMRRVDSGLREMVSPIIEEGQILAQRRLMYRYSRSKGLTHEEAEDLSQTALIDAVSGFDPEKGAKFSTFCYMVCRADLNNFLKKKYRERNRHLVRAFVPKRPDLCSVTIAREYLGGKTLAVLAREMKCNMTAITHRLDLMGIPRRGKLDWRKKK